MSNKNSTIQKPIKMKLLILGDTAVGKTCVTRQFTRSSFSNSYIATLGVDYESKRIVVDEKEIILQIWDTAGQERFRSITRSYYQGSHGVIVMFDLSSKETFQHVLRWITDIQSHTDDKICMILAGNKYDLKKREVTESEAQAIASRHNMKYIETSAKTNYNVENLFTEIATDILNSPNFKLKESNKESGNKSSSSCC